MGLGMPLSENANSIPINIFVPIPMGIPRDPIDSYPRAHLYFGLQGGSFDSDCSAGAGSVTDGHDHANSVSAAKSPLLELMLLSVMLVPSTRSDSFSGTRIPAGIGRVQTLVFSNKLWQVWRQAAILA